MHRSNPPRHHASDSARAARRLEAQLAREAAKRRHPANAARALNTSRVVTS